MLMALEYYKLGMDIKLAKFLKEEKGEVNIVAIVVLIGIVIMLAIAFRDQIAKLLGKLFGIIFKSTEGVDDSVTIKVEE